MEQPLPPSFKRRAGSPRRKLTAIPWTFSTSFNFAAAAAAAFDKALDRPPPPPLSAAPYGPDPDHHRPARNRRRRDRVHPGLLDRPSDPRRRAARLRFGALGGVQRRHPARRDPRRDRALLANLLGGARRPVPPPGRILALPAQRPGRLPPFGGDRPAAGRPDRGDARKPDDRRGGADRRRNRDPRHRAAGP